MPRERHPRGHAGGIPAATPAASLDYASGLPRRRERHPVGTRAASRVQASGPPRPGRPPLTCAGTLITASYALTPQIFTIYSVPMDTELAALEDKIRQTIQLCQRLRDENDQLRQQVLKLETDRKRLTDKIDGARTRVESLLSRFPE